MSFSALKKQINKANQVLFANNLIKRILLAVFKFLSESVGVAEATKLDDEFNEMERVNHCPGELSNCNIWKFQKVDLTNELVSALVAAASFHK